MINKKYILFFSLILSFGTSLFSNVLSNDDKEIDSLNQIINNTSNHDTIIILSYLNLSDYYYYDNPDKAIEICETALKIAESGFFLKEKASTYSRLGFIYQHKGDLKKVLEYYIAALEIFRTLNDREGISTSLNNLAVAYNNQGDIKKALIFFHKGLIIQEEIKDYYGIGNSLNNIGSIYKQQGEIDKALGFYQQSLEVREREGNKVGIANSLHNIGSIYKEKGELVNVVNSDKLSKKNYLVALDFYKNSLDILEEIGHQYGISASLSSIGKVHELLSDDEKALEYYNSAILIQENLGYQSGIAKSLNNISAVQLKMNNIQKAFINAEKGLFLSKEIGYPKITMVSAKLLSEIYKLQNKGIKAFEMYELHISIRDSIQNENNQKLAIQLQAEYEYEKQRILDDIENEKIFFLKEKDKKRQRRIIIFISSGLIFTVILLLFVINRLKTTKKEKKLIFIHQKEIEAFNRSLKKKNIENITLVKEVHHRVKNNLQIIISLLRMQRTELKSNEAKEDFTEAINRILTMSLIHEKLYGENELANIDFKKYIEELVKDLISISLEKDKVKLSVESTIEEMDLNMIVPIGLLINELVSNSLKYAFTNKEKGHIDIVLNQEKGFFSINYHDDGEWKEIKDTKKGFGAELIDILTEQLNGTKTFSLENGTNYNFTLKESIQ